MPEHAVRRTCRRLGFSCKLSAMAVVFGRKGQSKVKPAVAKSRLGEEPDTSRLGHRPWQLHSSRVG